MKFIDSLKEKIKVDSEKTSKHFALLMNVLFSIVLLLKILNYLPSYWDTTYLFYFIVLVNSIWLMFKIKNIPEEKRDKNPMIYIFQYLFLLILIVFAINQFVKNQIVEEWTPYLIALSIGLGFLTFYAHRNKVENEIEDEKNKEDEKEKKRKEEFSTKYPTINKIPFLRSLVKWMYKEGWGYSLALLVIVVIGFVLRIWNLGNYSFNSDEFIVNMVAQNIITKGQPVLETGFYYLRDIFHTVIVSLSFLIFENNEFYQRLPSLIAGMGIIFISYLLIKKISLNKKISIIGALIFSVHPWFVEYSRYGKSYILATFLSLTCLYFFILSINKTELKYSILAAIFGTLAIISHAVSQTLLFFGISVAMYSFNTKPIKKWFFKSLISIIPLIISILALKIMNRMEFVYQANPAKIEAYTNQGIITKIIALIPFKLTSFDIEKIIYFSNSVQELYIFIVVLLSLALLISLCIKKKELKRVYLFLFVGLTAYALSYVFVNLNYASYLNLGYITFSALLIITSCIPLSFFRFKKKILFTLSVLIVFSLFLYLPELINISSGIHGTPIRPEHSKFEGFVFVQDNKSPNLFIKDNYNSTTDIIIILGAPSSTYIYSKIIPEFYVWTEQDDIATKNNTNVYVSSKKISNLKELEKTLNTYSDKRIWFLYTYSMLSGDNKLAPRIWHINSDIQNYFKNLKKEKVFIGEDKITSVYLVQNFSNFNPV